MYEFLGAAGNPGCSLASRHITHSTLCLCPQAAFSFCVCVCVQSPFFLKGPQCWIKAPPNISSAPDSICSSPVSRQGPITGTGVRWGHRLGVCLARLRNAQAHPFQEGQNHLSRPPGGAATLLWSQDLGVSKMKADNSMSLSQEVLVIA